MTISTQHPESGSQGLLATAAAIFALAGGLIHLAVVGSHLDYPLVAAGFAVMGTTQWAFALGIVKRPTRRLVVGGAVLHAGIAGIWVLSRTVGVPSVAGAEQVAAVGVADLVANIFSVGVVGAAVVWIGLSGAPAGVNVSSRATRVVAAAVAAGSLFLTVPALLAPHDHSSHAASSATADADESHTHEPDEPGAVEHRHEDDGAEPTGG